MMSASKAIEIWNEDYLDSVKAYNETHNVANCMVRTRAIRRKAATHLSMWKLSATRASDPTA